MFLRTSKPLNFRTYCEKTMKKEYYDRGNFDMIKGALMRLTKKQKKR